MKKIAFFFVCLLISVYSFAQIKDSITANPNIVCRGHQSILTVNVSGGIPPYSYLWSNSSTDSSIIVYPTPSAHIYSVTVTDHNSASNSAQTFLYADSMKIDSIHTIFDSAYIELIPYVRGFPPFTNYWNTSPPQYSPTCYVHSNGIYCVYVIDSDGCRDSSCVSVDVLSINKFNTNVNVISIYPNPSTSSLTIETPQNSTIEIINLEGQIVKSLAGKAGNTTIDVSAIPAGIYFVEIKSEKVVTVKKFIKE